MIWPIVSLLAIAGALAFDGTLYWLSLCVLVVSLSIRPVKVIPDEPDDDNEPNEHTQTPEQIAELEANRHVITYDNKG